MKRRIISIILAMSLVLSMAAALGVTACAKENVTKVHTWSGLQEALKENGTVILTDDVIAGSEQKSLDVEKGTTVTIDLNGFNIRGNG